MPKSDFETAPPVHSNPTQADRSRASWNGQRLALAFAGILASGGLVSLAGCPGNLDNAQIYNIDDPRKPSGQAGSGTAGGGATTPGLNVNTDCLVAVFTSSCSSLGCHSAMSPAADLDLASPGVNARLIDVTATHATAVPNTGCINGQKLIDSANPNASWLLGKLTTDGMTCGFTMPIGNALTADQTACLKKYVQDVAASAGGNATPASGGAGGAPAATAGATGSAGSNASGGSSGASATAGGGGM